jgi:hypothetical protein
MKHILGSIENPVKCESPIGETTYLNTLAGPNGERIYFRRLGSKRSPDKKVILDAYHLTSPDFQFDRIIYMNMYVKGYKEKKPIEGLRCKKSFLKNSPGKKQHTSKKEQTLFMGAISLLNQTPPISIYG